MSKRRRKPNRVIGWVNVYLDDSRGESHPVLRKGGLCCSSGAFGWYHYGGPVRFEISITKKPRWSTPYRKDLDLKANEAPIKALLDDRR